MPSTPLRTPETHALPARLPHIRSRIASPSLPKNADNTALRRRLLILPFPAFAITVVQLLRRLGYQEVTLRGVGGTRGKGRNAYGGLDIEAVLQVGLTRSRVICQLRQYDKEPVARQSVDVLRGTMLRVGAVQGLLVTTSTFSPSALEATQAAQHLAPIRLIDGVELAGLLRTHGILSDPADDLAKHDDSGVKSRDVLPTRPIARTRPISREEADAREADFLRSLEEHREQPSQTASPEAQPHRGSVPPHAPLRIAFPPSSAPAYPGVCVTVVIRSRVEENDSVGCQTSKSRPCGKEGA